MAKTRVLLVDDQQVFRAGMRTLLSAESDFEVVGEASDTRTALAEDERLLPNVTLVDFWLPDGDGVSLIRELRRRNPDRRVALLSASATAALIFEALQAGACGVLLKLQPVPELIAGLRTMGRGELYVPAELAASVAEQRARVDDKASTAFDTLSPQEKEVCRLLIRGRSNVEIAHDLFISIKTVQTLGERILAKLGIESIADLVRYAERWHLLES